MRRLLPFAMLLALAPYPIGAQTADEQQSLFSDDFNDEQFFKLEEEAVTIASKHAQSSSEAPASVTVLTSEDILRYGFRDFRDLLRSVAGWYVSDGHDYVYAGNRGVMLRGDQNTRILVLVDGHTLNEAWASSSSLDEGLGLDLDAISRVEILQGPSSTLYGSNAFLGIINIVTRDGNALSKASAQLDLASFGRTQFTVASGSSVGDFRYHLRLGVSDETGRYLWFPERSTTSESAGFTSPEADATRGYHAFLKLNYKDLRLLAIYADRVKHVPTAPFDTLLNAPENRFEQRRWFSELRYDHTLNERIEVHARAYLDGFRFQDFLLTHGEEEAPLEGNVEPSERDNAYLFRDIASADWIGGELQTGVTLASSSQARDQLYLGVETTSVQTRSRSLIEESTDDATPEGELADVSAPALTLGAYLQNELSLFQTFTAVVGLRFDYNSNFFANSAPLQTLSPRGALIFRSRSDSTFKLMYARGFRNPSIYEAYFDDTSDILANPGLAPESIHNLEFAYEYRLQKFFRLNLSTYYFRAADLLEQQTVCLTPDVDVVDCSELRQQFQNIAQVEGLGSELSAVAAFDNGARVRGTLALQKVSDLGSFRPLANSPSVVANLMGSYPLLKDRFFASASLHVVSARQAGPDEAGEFLSVPGYALANLVFSSRDLIKGLELSTGVYNALNQQYTDVAVSEKVVVDQTDIPVLTLPTDGRTFAFRLSYRY